MLLLTCNLNRRNPSLDLTLFSTDQQDKQVWALGGGWAAHGPSPTGVAEVQLTNHKQSHTAVTSRVGVWSLNSPFSALGAIRENKDDSVLFGP